LSLKDVVLQKIEQKPQTITQLFDDLNEKDDIKRESIRGRLSELKKDGLIKKVGDMFSKIPTK